MGTASFAQRQVRRGAPPFDPAKGKPLESVWFLGLVRGAGAGGER